MQRGSSDDSSKGSWAKGLKLKRPPERNPNVFGEIPGFPVGSTFANRIECSEAGVHGPLRAGIHGNQNEGAFSVVLSGGYEDDEDGGDTIIYTGQGGRDTKGSKLDQMMGKILWKGPQNADQEWIRGNKALKISSSTNNPIRVIRGHTLDSRYAPAEGYRYDGLYEVTDAWRAKGKTGFKTCRFTFQRLPGQPPIPGTLPERQPGKTGSSKARFDPTAKVPSLLQVAVPSELASIVERPNTSIGTPHVKKMRLDKPSFQSISTAKRSSLSNITIPPANAAVPLKLENLQPSKTVATSSRQPPKAEGLIRRPLKMAPPSTIDVEPIRKSTTLRPTPTASLMKRHRNDSDDDTAADDFVDGDSDSCKHPKLKKPIAIHPMPCDKWATVAGNKKYAEFHFKKKRVE